MHQLKFLLSKSVRSPMIYAAVLCVIASACEDQQPTAPKAVARIARSQNVAFNKFFVAWSQDYNSGSIGMQNFTLDARQVRQYGGLAADDGVLSFARANPGQLYIVGDEPDQWCITPSDYVGIYHDFVAGVRAVDPTARFSPAGTAEPNAHCCPPPDDVPTPCWSAMHTINYAQQFYDIYVQRYGSAPTVSEWRFHDFALAFSAGDIAGWWARVDKEASWAVAHGAPMFLGAWGFLGWRESDADYQEHIKRGMNLLLNDPRIVGAAYWAYHQWAGERHFLTSDDGSLTAEGQVYANPLSNIPNGVSTVAGSSSGQAKLQWTNTTSAWAAEAEFWVRSGGSSSFVYKTTERVAGPGATETPLDVFNPGDSVRGRVRYYNATGQAEWSSFSNALGMPQAAVVPPPPPQPPPTAPLHKAGGAKPLFCSLVFKILNEQCNSQ
jgi:hypothetical protein